MNIERKILVKLKNIHSLDQNKKLLRSGYHNQYNTFLSNISFVPVLSSSQLPPKNHLSLTSNHLNDYYYLNLPNDNTYTLDEIIKILKQHPDIEYVQKIPKLPVQPPNITPDLTRHQHYLKTPKIKSNEINGLGIIDAWNKNAYGQGIQVADIEWDFDLSHPDLLANNIT
ncbi:serine protease, partial [Proteus mirabilis]|nr:serine protease [Proteus mirabilis]MCD4625447.1 serine protease [Proteus mirabilis]MCD4638329.1 serine protease [Proteus mirabilis]